MCAVCMRAPEATFHNALTTPSFELLRADFLRIDESLCWSASLLPMLSFSSFCLVLFGLASLMQSQLQKE